MARPDARVRVRFLTRRSRRWTRTTNLKRTPRSKWSRTTCRRSGRSSATAQPLLPQEHRQRAAGVRRRAAATTTTTTRWRVRRSRRRTTSGSVPSSPVHTRPDDNEFEEATQCAWEGCKAGDTGNMDRLVEHIHNEHIEHRQKSTRASGSAARARACRTRAATRSRPTRSHEEKPKWMLPARFVHPEPFIGRHRPTDSLSIRMRLPPCLTHHPGEAHAHRARDRRPTAVRPGSKVDAGAWRRRRPAGKTAKVKIVLKTPAPHREDTVDDSSANDDNGPAAAARSPSSSRRRARAGFTARELAMLLERLHKLCRPSGGRGRGLRVGARVPPVGG